MFSLVWRFCLLAVPLFLASCASEQDGEIHLYPLLDGGLAEPLFLTHAGDDRLFVVEREGTIRVVRNGVLSGHPFLDIREKVGSNSREQGLLSVAFHPEYRLPNTAGNGSFFVNYTDLNGDTVIARFQASDDGQVTASPASELILMKINQPFPNHNGGQIAFGPDGYLYIGMGDGGSGGDPQGNGQDLQSLLGAMLRLDVSRVDEGRNYAIPETNPFRGEDDGRAEIWSYGLRNPWRFSFDRLTGDLYIGDVGQNRWEELNFQPSQSAGGHNYGWNITEGSHCFRNRFSCDKAGLELPIFEFSHEFGACTIVGGYAYRGNLLSELQGNYFFADFCNGQIWQLALDDDGRWIQMGSMNAGFQVSSFGEDSEGELYILDYDDGRILQFRAAEASE